MPYPEAKAPGAKMTAPSFEFTPQQRQTFISALIEYCYAEQSLRRQGFREKSDNEDASWANATKKDGTLLSCRLEICAGPRFSGLECMASYTRARLM